MKNEFERFYQHYTEITFLGVTLHPRKSVQTHLVRKVLHRLSPKNVCPFRQDTHCLELFILIYYFKVSKKKRVDSYTVGKTDHGIWGLNKNARDANVKNDLRMQTNPVQTELARYHARFKHEFLLITQKF